MDSNMDNGTTSTITSGPIAFGGILEFTKAIQHNYENNIFHAIPFTLDVRRDELWNAYINAFPEEKKKIYNCSCCRGWFAKIGGLVTIDKTTGEHKSALFDDLSNIPEEYIPSVVAVLKIISKARVRSFFTSKKEIVGSPVSGNFHHLSTFVGNLSPQYSNGERLIDTNRLSEERRIFAEGLAKYRISDFVKARTFFINDSELKYYKKFIDIFDFLIQVKESIVSIKSENCRHNLLTYHALMASAGKTHFASTVIGEFLNTVKNDTFLNKTNYEQAKRNFLLMVDPVNYLRPKAPPSEGTVKTAEKMFAELGLASSLRRRSMRRDELPQEAFIWKPAVDEKSTVNVGRLFEHLATKNSTKEDKLPIIEGGVMTWEKFSQRYLKTATKIEVHLPNICHIGSLMTAADPDSNPILQWDKPEKRNPVSYYRYKNPTNVNLWSLKHGLNELFGIIRIPDIWGSDKVDNCFLMVTKEGFDPQKKGIGLFPEDLKPQFHEVRSVIEAFSNTSEKENNEEGMAVLAIGGPNINASLLVTTPEAIIRVTIDRFE